MNPLLQLHDQGQSVWLDYIRRDLISGEGLRTLIERDGVRGVTSNPSIFEKAIESSTDYDEFIAESLARDPRVPPQNVYDALAIEDVGNAADLLRPVYEQSNGADGYVSIEPPPQLTRDTAATISEARRIWRAIGRPNIMIKVVGSKEGVPAVEELIAAGINVNITLLFSLRHYEAVAGAYIRGLERCREPERIASVASFFVSRVDTAIDKALESSGNAEALALRGKIAVANAKLAYDRFKEIFYGPDFTAQRRRGAHVQRPLWASTSAKNPKYRDVLYVEELIGRDTVNTMPLPTLEAFREHGHVRGDTVAEDLAGAREAIAALPRFGINLDEVAEKLQSDGITAFAKDYDGALTALGKKRELMAMAATKH